MTENYEDESLLGVENETELTELLKRRYFEGNIHSLIDDILLSINPCEDQCLEGEKQNLFQNVVKSAINNLRCHEKNQCIILKGDSGSGKTELANQLTAFITKATSTDHDLGQFIIQAGKLLEAFGNASTLTSTNASRFIKITELLFTDNIQLKGVYIHHYLLEKSRVVRHEKGEKTFHIFYQFLAGMTEENQYHLQPSVYHRCIGSDFDWSEDQSKYQEELSNVEECFKSLGFSQDNIETIYRILAAIIHFCDLTVMANPKSKAVQIGDFETLQKASSLLGVTPERLQFALVTEITYIKGRIARRARSMNEVGHARDMLAMALYTRLFAWIVWNINQYLSPYDAKTSTKAVSILDPFGFERLNVNGLEQLCINTTNEHLKFLYNQIVFAWETADQEAEGILIQKVDFPNNKNTIDFLMERPDGIFSLIDQESKSIKGSDGGLVKKITTKHRKHPCYSDSPTCPYPVFSINHYAGKVTYEAVDILRKNKDMLGGSLITCLQESEDDLIYRLFMVKLSPTGSIIRADQQGTIDIPIIPRKAERKKMQPTVRRHAEMIGNIQGINKIKVKKKKLIQEQALFTTTSQLRNTLSDLMQKNLKSELHFVCCIRPNKDLVVNQFDEDLVTAQLRYSGVMETVTMRRQGFPLRLSFKVFIERYKILSYPLIAQVKYNDNTCEKILSHVHGLGWKIGKTKIFMKSSCMRQLDDLLIAAHQAVIIVQKLCRGRRCRKQVKILKFKLQIYKGAIVDFVSQAHGNIDKLYNHLRNQVIEEDARALSNDGHTPNEQLKEKALQILDGTKQRQRKESTQSVSKNCVRTSTPSIAGQEDTVDSQSNLQVVEEANFSSSLNNQTPSSKENDSQIDENKNISTPRTKPLLSITDMFSPVGGTDVSSETATNPLGSVSEEIRDSTDGSSTFEQSESIMDVFGNGKSRDSETGDQGNTEGLSTTEQYSITDLFGNGKPSTHPEQRLNSDEGLSTPEQYSIMDVFFNDKPVYPDEENDKGLETSAQVSIADVMARSGSDDIDAPDDFVGSPERPSVVGKESNLSTFSFDNTFSQDDDMNDVAMEAPGIWCVITCYERDMSRGEFQVDRSVIIVDGSSNAFDVTRIGIGSLPMNPADEKVDKVRRCIGKGIKLTIDDDGNMWVKRCSKNTVFVKGCFLSPEVKDSDGELPRGQLIKVFDDESFSNYLQYECEPMRYEQEKGEAILSCTKVYFSFVKNAEHDVDTPCWIEVTMAEPFRIAKVALAMAKDRRRIEREKRGDRTPPILRAKIGKSRQVIAIGALEKKIRPQRYIDSFKYRRRGWARKQVSINPFSFGDEASLSPRGIDKEKRDRSQSSPGEFTGEPGLRDDTSQDDVFESTTTSQKKPAKPAKATKPPPTNTTTGKVWAKLKLKDREEKKSKTRIRSKTLNDM